MIQDRAEGALPAHAGLQVHVPGGPGHDETERTTLAAHRSDLADGSSYRWLMLAAEMVDVASSAGRLSPDPAPVGWASLPRVATHTSGGGAGSVRAARDFTVATLHRWSAADRSYDIAIVVSELLTNALRHARPGSSDGRPRRSIRLGLLQLGPGVLCAVADPSTMAPVLRPPGSLSETGRGLHIVCALSDRWGYISSGTGKVVWAMFTTRLTEPPVAW